MDFFKTAMSAAIMSIFGTIAMPAFADVTGPELWLEWQKAAQDSVQKLSVSSQSYSNGVMTLSGLTNTIALPEAKVVVLVPEIIMSDQKNGAVEVSIPDPVKLEVVPAYETNGRASLLLTHEGLSLIAAGTDDHRTYSYAADVLTIILDEFVDRADVVPVEMSLIARSFLTDYVITGRGTDEARISNTGTIAQFDATLSVTDPTEDSLEMSYQLRDIRTESAGPIVAWSQFDDPSAVFVSDQVTSVSLSHGGGGYFILVEDPTEPLEISSSSSGGAVDIEIKDGSALYGVNSQGLKTLIRTPDISFPIEVSADRAALSARVPMVARDSVSDFGLSIDLSGLTLSKSIWSMFDELNALPRDPVSLLVALSGKVELFADLFDPSAADGQIPGDIKAFAVDALEISAFGADLKGSGAFAVDTASQGLIPNAPKLVGSAEVMLVGAYGLIDNLIKIGVLKPEDAIGARMMMSMLARPGKIADSLVSTVELTERGGLIANGMQLQ